jgi:hypothetical protein
LLVLVPVPVLVLVQLQLVLEWSAHDSTGQCVSKHSRLWCFPMPDRLHLDLFLGMSSIAVCAE